MATASLDQGHKIEITFDSLIVENRGERKTNLGTIQKAKYTLNNCLALFIGSQGGDNQPGISMTGATLEMMALFDSTTTRNSEYTITRNTKNWVIPDGEIVTQNVAISTLTKNTIPAKYLEYYPDLPDIIGDRTLGVAYLSLNEPITASDHIYLEHAGDTESTNGVYSLQTIDSFTGSDIYISSGAMSLFLDSPLSSNTNAFNPVEYPISTFILKEVKTTNAQALKVGQPPFISTDEEFTYTYTLEENTNYHPMDGIYQFLSNFASDGSGDIGTNPFVDYSDEDIRYKGDFTLNIDGSKNPTLAIHGSSPMIENATNPNYKADGTLMHVYAGKEDYGIVADLGYFGYGKSAVYSWKEIGEKVGVNNIDKIASLITSDIGNITIMARFEYEDGKSSSIVGAKVSYTGEDLGTAVSSPSDGSTITITHGRTEDSYTDYDDDIDTITGGDPLGGTGLLTRTYIVSATQLQQLGAFLWDNDFLENFVPLSGNAIENIISVKVYPYHLVGGAPAEIVLGNLPTGVNGNPVTYNYNSEKSIGSITIPKKYNSFLDYSPYTQVSIFLPYIGFQTLDAEEVLGHTLSVKYFVDIVTGQCMACIYADNIPIGSYCGQIGLDVPIMATNRAQIEAGLISGALNTAVNVVAGNTLGAVANAGKTLVDAATKKYSVSSVGSASPACFNYMTHDVFIIIDRPVVQYPSNYNHTYGKPCNLTKTLGSLRGFTVVNDADLSGITCTDAEKEMIRNYLKGGIIL